MEQLSQIFRAIEAGEPIETADVLPKVYDELRRIARALLSQESPGQTLQATALVHEAYLRLTKHIETSPDDGQESSVGSTSSSSTLAWKSKAHFFAAAAEAMRRILIDAARRKKRLKRGGDRKRVDFEPAELVIAAPPDELLALDEALQRLENQDKLKANVVKLRYFAGLSVEETAQALDISTATVKRYWAYSKAWLRREMDGRTDS